ncbi:LysR family transcriptional regulator [Hwanghaeella sp.]|uniref:LysR family transcriptional regulator n=1 Tax=Hwanghaeella sp. TaxID=2605943 RepID=UPI003CCB8B82
MARRAFLGRIGDADIRLLRVFSTVAACGGLAAAETELNISRSTISRHISNLEERLAVRLCERGAAGFALTQEGERVLEAASRLLSSLNSFQSDINEIHAKMTGHLSVAMFDKSVTNPAAHLPKAIAMFNEVAPDVTLGFYGEPVNTIENGILTGRLDMAIVPVHQKFGTLTYSKLYPEQMYLYCAAGHSLFDKPDDSVTRKDVQACNYAGIGFQSPNMLNSHKFELERKAEVYDEEALAALVFSGRFIGFLPEHFAERFETRGTLRKIRPDIFTYVSDHWAIVRRAPKPSRLVMTFLDCLHKAHGLSASGHR